MIIANIEIFVIAFPNNHDRVAACHIAAALTQKPHDPVIPKKSLSERFKILGFTIKFHFFKKQQVTVRESGFPQARP